MNDFHSIFLVNAKKTGFKLNKSVIGSWFCKKSFLTSSMKHISKEIKTFMTSLSTTCLLPSYPVVHPSIKLHSN